MGLGVNWKRAVMCGVLLCAAGQAYAQILLRVGGAGADLETMRMLGRVYQQAHPHVRVEVLPSLGTSGGIKAVKAGALDIGLAGRPLESRELSWGLKLIPYARVPVVFAVPASSPQRQITLEQLKAIYAGRTRHWPDGSLVRLILRPQTDTDTRRILETLPGLEAAMAATYMRRGIPVSPTDQEHAEAVASTPGALGYVTLSVILAELRALRPLALEGVVPYVETVANKEYPVMKTLYFVVPERVSTHAQAFMDFIRTPHAREIMERTGHIVEQPRWR